LKKKKKKNKKIKNTGEEGLLLVSTIYLIVNKEFTSKNSSN